MNPTNSVEKTSWFHRTWLVIFLCIFCFPVGIFALWKSTEFAPTAKIIGTILSLAIGLFLLWFYIIAYFIRYL
ncbi:hypothetical protein GCM10028808_21060 [Spirosoma migulaei]